jgi:hypothetical protein
MMLLAQRMEQIRAHERRELLIKFRHLINLSRYRQAQKILFTDAYIKFWTLESLKKWYEHFKNLRPANNTRRTNVRPLPFIIAHVNLGEDVTKNVPVVVNKSMPTSTEANPLPTENGDGTNPLPTSDGNDSNPPQGANSTQKVLVLQGAPTCGTKQLYFDEDGNPQKSNAKQQSLFTPSQFEGHDIQSLAAEQVKLFF